LIEHLYLFACSQWNWVFESSCGPRMLQGSFGIIPLNLTNPAQLRDEIFCQRCHVPGIVPLFWLDCCHFLFDGVDIVGHDTACDVQGMVSHQHLVEDNACRVHVNLFTIRLTRDLFWSHVKYSTNFCLVSQFHADSLLRREAKVNDLEFLCL
jgi:hypothetical protein